MRSVCGICWFEALPNGTLGRTSESSPEPCQNCLNGQPDSDITPADVIPFVWHPIDTVVYDTAILTVNRYGFVEENFLSRHKTNDLYTHWAFKPSPPAGHRLEQLAKTMYESPGSQSLASSFEAATEGTKNTWRDLARVALKFLEGTS